MASSIFGTPEENPPSWAKSAGIARLCGQWSRGGPSRTTAAGFVLLTNI